MSIAHALQVAGLLGLATTVVIALAALAHYRLTGRRSRWVQRPGQSSYTLMALLITVTGAGLCFGPMVGWISGQPPIIDLGRRTPENDGWWFFVLFGAVFFVCGLAILLLSLAASSNRRVSVRFREQTDEDRQRVATDGDGTAEERKHTGRASGVFVAVAVPYIAAQHVLLSGMNFAVAVVVGLLISAPAGLLISTSPRWRHRYFLGRLLIFAWAMPYGLIVFLNTLASGRGEVVAVLAFLSALVLIWWFTGRTGWAESGRIGGRRED